LIDAGPPRDEWAERAVLASIISDPRIVGDVAERLSPDDLTGPREQAIYLAMLRLHRRGVPCDATLVWGELCDSGHADRTGDGERVTVGGLLGLFDLLPSAARWAHYVVRVLKVSRERRAYYRGIRLLGAVGRASHDREGAAR
jgi:replicative DNA helicase